MKLQEVNIGEVLLDLGIESFLFFDRTPKAQAAAEAKIDQWDFIHWKTLALQRKQLMQQRGKLQNRRKHSQTTQLTRDCCPE